MIVIVYAPGPGAARTSESARASLQEQGFDVLPGYVRTEAEARAAISSGLADIVHVALPRKRRPGRAIALVALAAAWLASRRRELSATMAGATLAATVVLIPPAASPRMAERPAPEPTVSVPVLESVTPVQPAQTPVAQQEPMAEPTPKPPSPTPSPAAVPTPSPTCLLDVDLELLGVRACVGQPNG